MEYIDEGLKWTNLKAAKVALSDDMSAAIDYTKQANKFFQSGDYKEAGDLYKKALPIWNRLIRDINSIPETVGWWGSMSNWVIFVPFLNWIVIILGTIQSMRTDVTPGSMRYVSPKLADKLNEAIQTKSFSKKIILNGLVIAQDFCEDRANACKDGKFKSAFENWELCVLEGYANAVIECGNSTLNSSDKEPLTVEAHLIEDFIHGYV